MKIFMPTHMVISTFASQLRINHLHLADCYAFNRILVCHPCTGASLLFEDMVAEKLPNVAHDFTHDPIVPIVCGDKLTASGTSLGADNGLSLVEGGVTS